MAECSLENCNEECFENEDKCILHCDKRDIYSESLVKKKFEEQLKIKYSNSINKFEKIIFPDINNIFDQTFNEISFQDCTFYGIQILNDFPHTDDVTLFDNCIFNNYISFHHIHFKCNIFRMCRFSNLVELTIYDSTFKKQLFYKNLHNNYPSKLNLIYCKFTNERFIVKKANTIIDTIKIEYCRFNSNFEISNCLNITNLTITNSLFNSNLQLLDNTIEKMSLLLSTIEGTGLITNSTIVSNDIYGVVFNEFANFQYSKFKSILNLSNVHFSKQSSFYNTTVEQSINLENTTFANEVNFIALSSKQRIIDENKNFVECSTPANVLNRETARKIKDSFEKQNNIIEANKYYVIEMKEREKELEITKNPFDWLVFKVHRWSSNHSQNWLLPLVWIFIISYLVTSIKTTYGIFETILYNIFIFGVFDKMANVINPFSIMTRGEILTFNMLFLKVIIAYLIYQFIVSIRQNTRRK